MNKSKISFLAIFLFPICLMAQSVEGSWTTEAPGYEEGTTIKIVLKMENGGYAVDFGNNGTTEVNGKYTMDGNQITIEDIDGTNACVGKKGIYEVEVNATNLILTRISDDCQGRGGPDGMTFTRM